MADIQNAYAQLKGFSSWDAFNQREMFLILDDFYQTHGRFIKVGEIIGIDGLIILPEIKRRKIGIAEMGKVLTGKSTQSMADIQNAYAQLKGFASWDVFWQREVFVILNDYLQTHGRFITSTEIRGVKGVSKYPELRGIGLREIGTALTGGSTYKMGDIKRAFTQIANEGSKRINLENSTLETGIDAQDWIKIFQVIHDQTKISITETPDITQDWGSLRSLILSHSVFGYQSGTSYTEQEIKSFLLEFLRWVDQHVEEKSMDTKTSSLIRRVLQQAIQEPVNKLNALLERFPACMNE